MVFEKILTPLINSRVVTLGRREILPGKAHDVFVTPYFSLQVIAVNIGENQTVLVCRLHTYWNIAILWIEPNLNALKHSTYMILKRILSIWRI